MMSACFVVLFTFLLAVEAEPIVSSEKGSLQGPLFPRIINGEEATRGEFPHQIMLLHKYRGVCGGSVISKSWVLTAAHCLDKRNMTDLRVVVNLHRLVKGENFDMFKVTDLIIHEGYREEDDKSVENDLALLRLDTASSNADISRNIIRLPSGCSDFAGIKCVITGWGLTENDTHANVLMKREIMVISNSECATSWEQILDQQICVKDNHPQGGSSCDKKNWSCSIPSSSIDYWKQLSEGDSGGPVVCHGVLAGVASWGTDRCHVNGIVTHPSVYARVTFFRDWIKRHCDDCKCV